MQLSSIWCWSWCCLPGWANSFPRTACSLRPKCRCVMNLERDVETGVGICLNGAMKVGGDLSCQWLFQASCKRDLSPLNPLPGSTLDGKEKEEGEKGVAESWNNIGLAQNWLWPFTLLTGGPQWITPKGTWPLTEKRKRRFPTLAVSLSYWC